MDQAVVENTSTGLGTSAKQPAAGGAFFRLPSKGDLVLVSILASTAATNTYYAREAVASSACAYQFTSSGGDLGDAHRPSNQVSAASDIRELRRRSGLTWEQIAILFGVDRRSIHFWASGRPLNAANAERLGRVLSVVRRVDRGSVRATRAWLMSPSLSGLLPIDLLREGRYDEVPTPNDIGYERSGPVPVDRDVLQQRRRRPPTELVAALTDSVHDPQSRLIATKRLDWSTKK